MDDITRIEQEIVRLEARLDSKFEALAIRMSGLEIELAKQGATQRASLWKLVACSLIGFIVGVSPYILHIGGLIK